MKNIEMLKDKSGEYSLINEKCNNLQFSSKSVSIGFFEKRILTRIKQAEY